MTVDEIIAFVICGPSDPRYASLGFVGLFRIVSNAEWHTCLAGK